MTGQMDFRYENAPTTPELRRYRAIFLPFGEHGAAQHQRSFIGEESLRDFLTDFQTTPTAERREYWVKQWLLELHSTQTLNLPNVTIDKF